MDVDRKAGSQSPGEFAPQIILDTGGDFAR